MTKQTYTGTLKLDIISPGSKSEHEAIVLITDSSRFELESEVPGALNFPAALRAFNGVSAVVTGEEGTGHYAGRLFVDSLSDIKTAPVICTPPPRRP